jgi:hypothetical protein
MGSSYKGGAKWHQTCRAVDGHRLSHELVRTLKGKSSEARLKGALNGFNWGLVTAVAQARKQSDKVVNHTAIACLITSVIGNTIVLRWVAPKTALSGSQFLTQRQPSESESRRVDAWLRATRASYALPSTRVEYSRSRSAIETESLHIGCSFSLRFHIVRRSKATT